MKPPSRKHYEKSEVERLKEKIRRLESKPPEFDLLKRMLEDEQREVRTWKNSYTHAMDRLKDLEKVSDYMNFLGTQEVFIADDEGMKVLKGMDLFAYCQKRVDALIEEDRKRHAGYETIGLGKLLQPYQERINDIFSKVYAQHAADAFGTYEYKTKGRYDTRSQSKEEGS